MKTLTKADVEIGSYLIQQDTVRPELDYNFRTTNGREFYVLVDHSVAGACICVAYTHEVPKTVEELKQYSSLDGNIAIFYTVWSYTKGSGRDIVFNVVDYIKHFKPNVKRFVTLSPKTEMAKRFHLKNGAFTLSENDESVNYEYPV